MAMTTKELMAIVETLPIEIKIELIEKLLNSLHPLQKEIDKLWIEEAKRRLKEIESGKINTVSMEKVFENVFKKYNK